MRCTTVIVAVALAACRGGDDGRSASASATLVAARDGKVVAVNVDEGTVTRFDPASGEAAEVAVGLEPTRIARGGDRLYVTLRGEGAVAMLRDGPVLEVEETAEVGAEPYGVVATADGGRIYVALSMQDQVQELDGATLEKLRVFDVLDEPRWLALNPTESALFVASARDGRFSRIDLGSGEVTTVRLPKTGQDHGEGMGQEGGPQPDEPTSTGGGGSGPVKELTPRVTGDLVISPDGTTLGLPVVYADNTTPVTSDPDDLEGGGGYASGGRGEATEVKTLGRLNPALVLFPIDEAGHPEDEGRAVFLGVQSDGRAFKSYPNAVTAPDDRYFVVSMEGSNGVLVVDSEPYRGQGRDEPGPELRGGFDGRPAQLFNFWIRPVTPITTGAGPRSVVFDGRQLLVHDFLDRDLAKIPWDDALAANRHEADDKKQVEPATVLEARADNVNVLAVSALPPDVERGRRLFYSAIDREVTSRTGGVSCATCHFDGRDDGLTWTFEEDGAKVRLQTPSLAGRVSETAPLTWRDDVGSVAEEALLTSTLRMGGKGPDDADLFAIQAFVDAIRLPILPEQDDALVAEGAAIFAREDVGCATCHSGYRLTDGQHHEVAGLVSNTPSLNGVAATAPYLHDGSFGTLDELLDWTSAGAMGDTSMLSERERGALEAYLRSL